MRLYITKSKKRQFMPSLSDIERMDGNDEGMCIACGSIECGIEPDASKCVCTACGEWKVYGGEQLAAMGLVYDEDEA